MQDKTLSVTSYHFLDQPRITNKTNKTVPRSSARIMSASDASSAACRASTLTAEDARTIYQVKKKGKSHRDAASLGKHYRITAKAVRDVWRHRTWSYATMCFWMPAEVNIFARRKMCAACCDAGISIESSKHACAKCKKIVRRILSHRAGLRQKKGAAATAGLAAEPPASGPSHESGDCSTFAPLRTSGWNQIWSRQDGLHDGLLQEALEFI
jgi:hypothetical protein